MSHRYKDAFPSFSEASLPTMPSHWEDISYRNDACPCFDTLRSKAVFVDFEHECDRDYEGVKRFSVVDYEGESLLHTDDWQEVLDFVG
jgi:hypothetical protein